MKETGVLFQPPMVHAMLREVGPKTQTRRVVKWRGLAPGLNLGFSGLQAERSGSNWVLTSPTRTSWENRSAPMPCPYGQPGDRLWVRETFWAFGRWETRFSEKKGRDEWHFVDLTTEMDRLYQYSDPTPTARRRRIDRSDAEPRWWRRPSIFMPRTASRITLEITEVRVQRLQEISEADVRAEGIQELPGQHAQVGAWWTADIEAGAKLHGRAAREAYRLLWEQINGAGSWGANPWVWAISFRRV